jgi:hypothetical protein
LIECKGLGQIMTYFVKWNDAKNSLIGKLTTTQLSC